MHNDIESLDKIIEEELINEEVLRLTEKTKLFVYNYYYLKIHLLSRRGVDKSFKLSKIDYESRNSKVKVNKFYENLIKTSIKLESKSNTIQWKLKKTLDNILKEN